MAQKAEMALVQATGSLPSSEEFDRANRQLDALLEQRDSDALFSVSTASEAAALYHERNEHKGVADQYARLKLRAEAHIGSLDVDHQEPLVLSDKEIRPQVRQRWRILAYADVRGMLEPLLDRLESDPVREISTKSAYEELRRAGVGWVPLRPFIEARDRLGLTDQEIVELTGWRGWYDSPRLRGRVSFRIALRIAPVFGMDLAQLPPCPFSISEKEARHRKNERGRLRRAERAAFQEKERNNAIKQAVRKAGGAAAELYAMAERMQDVLGQAHREASDPERRQAFSLAGEHYRKMRDEIARGFLAGSA